VKNELCGEGSLFLLCIPSSMVTRPKGFLGSRAPRLVQERRETSTFGQNLEIVNNNNNNKSLIFTMSPSNKSYPRRDPW
jgi:hypothetical protein